MAIKTVVALLIGLALASAHLAEAQQPKKAPRIGYLAFRAGPGPGEKAFLQGLQDLGYVEGKTITIEWRWETGKPEALADLAAELVRLKVDVLGPHAGCSGCQECDKHYPDCHGIRQRSRADRVCFEPCATGRERHRFVGHYAGACGEAVGAA